MSECSKFANIEGRDLLRFTNKSFSKKHGTDASTINKHRMFGILNLKTKEFEIRKVFKKIIKLYPEFFEKHEDSPKEINFMNIKKEVNNVIINKVLDDKKRAELLVHICQYIQT